MQNSQLSKRLDSLDILRGLDIFFLVAFEPLLFGFSLKPRSPKRLSADF